MKVNSGLEMTIQRELLYIEKREQKLARLAQKSKPGWKEELETKIPEKVRVNLEKAFIKAFSIIFKYGDSMIEKGIDKDMILKEYEEHDYAVRLGQTRKDLKKLRRDAGTADMKNMAVTSAEGIGLGILGIGLPDIVVFLGMLLKGVYETSLRYGFRYEDEKEKVLILKMMQASLSRGGEWEANNREADAMLCSRNMESSHGLLKKQIEETGKAFAVDMLMLKFIQGLPVVGIVGGAANPVYYRRVLRYVRLKYYKRYLLRGREADEKGL